MKSKNQKPTYINEKQLAKMVGRSERSIQIDRYKGRGIPYCKWGRRVMYDLDDVTLFMKSIKVQHSK